MEGADNDIEAEFRFFTGLAIILILGSVLTGCPAAEEEPPKEEEEVVPIPDLSGSWAGLWTDTDFDVTDTLEFDIVMDNFSATGTIGLDYFGEGDVAGSAEGSVEDETLTFTFTSSVGSGSGTVTGTTIEGEGDMSGAMVGLGHFILGGTVSETEINGTFNFDTGGQGIATLTRP